MLQCVHFNSWYRNYYSELKSKTRRDWSFSTAVLILWNSLPLVIPNAEQYAQNEKKNTPVHVEVMSILTGIIDIIIAIIVFT